MSWLAPVGFAGSFCGRRVFGTGAGNVVLIDEGPHMPLRRPTAETHGAINTPSVITHEGKRIAYYVRAVGGGALTGGVRRAYVIQPTGKIESWHRFM